MTQLGMMKNIQKSGNRRPQMFKNCNGRCFNKKIRLPWIADRNREEDSQREEHVPENV